MSEGLDEMAQRVFGPGGKKAIQEGIERGVARGVSTLRKRFLRLAAGLAAVLLSLSGGILFARHAGGQPVPASWPASSDEVRDAERIRSARNQIDQQANQLVQRATVRLRYSQTPTHQLTYDFEGMRWVEVAVPGVVAPEPVKPDVAKVDTASKQG